MTSAKASEGATFQLGRRLRVRGTLAEIRGRKAFKGHTVHDLLLTDIVAVDGGEPFGRQLIPCRRAFTQLGRLEVGATLEFDASIEPRREFVPTQEETGLPCDDLRLTRAGNADLVVHEAAADADMSGMEQLNVHPTAMMFPPMSQGSFAELVADIRAHGQREKTLRDSDGRILDGRHRELACNKLGVAPQFEVWNGDGSVVDIVLSRNLHRRHLSESQRAMVGARLKRMIEDEPLLAPTGTVVADLPHLRKGRSRKTAAKLVNVSERLVQDAYTVLQKCVSEVADAVDQGRLRVQKAKAFAKLSKTDQQKYSALDANTVGKVLARRMRRQAHLRDRAVPIHPAGEEGAIATEESAYAGPVFPYIFAPAPMPLSWWVVPENQQPQDPLAAFRALPVSDIAAADATLIIWANNHFLGEAMALAAGWGWSYKTSIAIVPGDLRGFPKREHHSHLVIFNRGTSAPRVMMPSSVLRIDGPPDAMKLHVAQFVVDLLDAREDVLQTYGEPAHPAWKKLADVRSGAPAEESVATTSDARLASADSRPDAAADE